MVSLCAIVLALSLFSHAWQPGTGDNVREKIIKKLKEMANSSKKDPFGTLFNKRFTATIPFDSSADGIVGAPEHANKLPDEFEIQRAVYKYKFKDGPAKEDMFVPKPLYQARTTDNGFDFLAMEMVGPSITDLLKLTEKEVKLTVIDVMRLLRRMYLILGLIHSAGFAHNDGHPVNWAVSLTRPHVLHLIDWGSAKQLTNDFRPAIQDLLHWVLASEAIGDAWPGATEDDNKFKAKVTEKVGALKALIQQCGEIWNAKKAGTFPEFRGYKNLKPTNAKALLDFVGYKDFRKIVDEWLFLAEDNFANKQPLTQW